jgi:endonuclease/exonuclease/phosphatase family metal-dependent hydrolase
MLPRTFTAFIAAAFLAITLAAQSPSPPASPFQLTATFWNVQWFPGRRPHASRGEENRQVRAVHDDLTKLASDLIVLEEVRDSDHAAMAVKSLDGFKVDVCSNFPPREGQKEAQQVAITSRLEPFGAWAELWKPDAAIMPPRGFAFAAYELAPRQILLVYGLHLKSNRGEIHEDIRIREASMRQLLLHMKAMNTAYGKLGSLTWLVGGDFNTAPGEPRFASEKTIPNLMADGFLWSWQGIPFASRITVPADMRFPAASFDHIFFRGATLTRAWVANTSPQSSDHRAVNVVLTLR